MRKKEEKQRETEIWSQKKKENSLALWCLLRGNDLKLFFHLLQMSWENQFNYINTIN